MFNRGTVVCTLLGLVGSLVLNIVIRSSLYNESLNFIMDFQALSTPGLTIFENLVSLLVNTIVVCALLGIIYVSFSRKIAALVFLIYFLINTWIMMIMKMSFE